MRLPPRKGKRRREYRWLRSDGTPNLSDRIHRVPGDMEIIARKPAIQVSPSVPIANALKLMSENYRSLLVSVAGVLKGLLLATDLIDYLGGGDHFKIVEGRHRYNLFSALDRESVKSIMIHDPIVAYTDEKLPSVLEKMAVYGIGLLPVVYRDGRVYGVITEHDVLKHLYGVVELGVKISKVMSSPVVTIGSNSSVWDAMKKIIAYGFRRLPVVEENTVIGIVTAMDLIRFFSPSSVFKRATSSDIREVLKTSITEVASKNLVTVKPEDDLSEAVKKMFSKNVSSVLVVNDDMELVGIATERDVLYALTVKRA
ncbi:MAG: histidine kinase [Thermoprotei archaeon]|nr:MAG: histidine kinase [Thermoprotei archaeon]